MTTSSPSEENSNPNAQPTILSLAQQTYRMEQQLQKQVREQNEQGKQAKQQKLLDVFRDCLEEEFDGDILAELAPRYSYNSKGNYDRPEAHITVAGHTWVIVRYTWDGSPRWEIIPDDLLRNSHLGKSHIPAGDRHLQHSVLFLIGKQHEQDAAVRHASEKQQREKEERTRAYEQARQREREQRATRFAHALTIHEALQREEEQRLAEARTHLWTWPEGVFITIYTLTYCIGAASHDDGTAMEYVTGWTRQDHLGIKEDTAYGPITLEDTVEHTYDYGNDHERESLQNAYTVTLSLLAHKPVWRHSTFGSTEALPDALKQTLYLEQPAHTYAVLDAEHVEHFLLTKESAEAVAEALEVYEQDHPFGIGYRERSVPVGKQPVAWIRELVEQAQAVKQ